MSELTDLGEYELHDLIAATLNDNGRVIGDDAAVVAPNLRAGEMLLVSTDRLAAGVPPQLRARLLTVQALSDIVCMGGRPLAMVVAVQIPRDHDTAELVDFLRQMRDEARSYGCDLVGGDTKEGATFSAVATALGAAAAGDVIRRTGARPGDIAAVTMCGNRRWGARWAYHLARTYDLPLAPSLTQALRDADINFSFPIRESLALAATGAVTAGLDLSDGLGAGLKILGRASEVGFSINPHNVRELVDPALAPVCDLLRLPLDALAWSPGYMWENLYTIHRDRWAQAEAAVAEAGGRLLPIGSVVDGGKGTDGVEDDLLDIASDEKFRVWAWEDRTKYWLERVRSALS
jgi:thiamine-monophosphate kinase